MDQTMWERAKQIVADALELSPTERREMVESACEGDDELLAHAETLLAAHEEAGDFLSSPTLAGARVAGSAAGRLEGLAGPEAVARLNAVLDGRYRLERKVGEGGMATVFLAHDVRHDRRVALKVLKPDLAAVVGAARFLAEIRTTANLQHPHILPLFDSGDADGFVFYVMPFVDGESLRQKLDREAQLPVEEAVEIATSVAEALDYAHRQGVIHRDIKPANILLVEGKPVVADFGIALAVNAGGGHRLTETGLSLGTPQYMSPEQATGDPTVGAGTDTYSLGCVLYEMLVGEPPYTGRTPQSILGKILSGEPDPVTGQRRAVPRNVAAATHKALEKLAADRFATPAAFAAALRDPAFRYEDVAYDVPGARRGLWNPLSLGLAATTVSLAAVAGSLSMRASERDVFQFPVPLVEGTQLGGWTDAWFGTPAATSMAFSPSGDLLVYSAWEGDSSRLYSRRLDAAIGEPVEGTEGASNPFFSPDGSSVGFLVGHSIRRVSLEDGRVETIADSVEVPGTFLGTPLARGAAWGDDGSIVYGGVGGIYRLTEGGGTPELLVAGGSAGVTYPRHFQPRLLPGSNTLLYHVKSSGDLADTEIAALDLDAAAGVPTTVIGDATDPRYVPETGHLLFMRRGRLMAVRFDADRLVAVGAAEPMLEGVMHSIVASNGSWRLGAGQVTISDAGHLAYVPGPELGGEPQPNVVVRVGLDGRMEPIPGIEPRQYTGQRRPSPDGRWLALTSGGAIYVHDLERDLTRRLTSTGGTRNNPFEWSSDSRLLAFSSNRDQPTLNVYVAPADGTAEPERIAPSDQVQLVTSWSSDGVLAWLEGGDIWVLPSGEEPRPFFTSDGQEGFATFSPDGRWLAFGSREGGDWEVFVRPYPEAEPQYHICSRCDNPRWAPDGERLYVGGPGEGAYAVMLSVDVGLGDSLTAGLPQRIIDPWRAGACTPVSCIDVLPDGSGFVSAVRPDRLEPDEQGTVAIRPDGRPVRGVSEFQVILNFRELLRRTSDE